MSRKTWLVVLAIGVFAGICIVNLDCEAGGMHGGIRVIGPDHHAAQSSPVTSNSMGQGMMHRGKERRNPMDATACIAIDWEEGAVLLHGVISAVNKNSLTLIGGAIMVDTSDAEIEFRPFFPRRGHHSAADSETIAEATEIQAGQHAFVIATVVESENGGVLKASKVRVMDVESKLLETDEGGIRGVLDSFDSEKGLASIAGIPILIDDSTVIRSHLPEGEEILPGDLAGAHVIFIDANKDEVADSLYAERIIIDKIKSDTASSGDGH